MRSALQILGGLVKLATLAGAAVVIPVAATDSSWLGGASWFAPFLLALAIAAVARGGARAANLLRLRDDAPREAPAVAHVVAPAPAPVSAPRSAPAERRPAARAPRGTMDHVIYRPGTPNVLSMTKWLTPDDRAPVVPSARSLDTDGAARLRRADGPSGTVVCIDGVLDALTAPELERALEDIVSERPASVSLDLSGLQQLDAAGVALLVRLSARCAKHGGTVRALGLRNQPLALLRLLRVERLFQPA